MSERTDDNGVMIGLLTEISETLRERLPVTPETSLPAPPPTKTRGQLIAEQTQPPMFNTANNITEMIGQLIDVAIADERERCAKIADQLRMADISGLPHDFTRACGQIAAAIRAGAAK